jgi:seryl-tRNA synthetase
MLDIKLIRENPDAVKAGLLRRDPALAEAVDRVRKIDEQRRKIIVETEALKNRRNVVSKEIGQLKSRGEDAAAPTASMKKVGDEIAALDQKLREADEALHRELLLLPNLPHESVPAGDAAANREIRTWGKKQKFEFKPKAHWELGEKLGILDFKGGAKISGSGFFCFRKGGARLERALIQLMLDIHGRDHGYTEISPPFLINEASMIGTGQLPKFAVDMYGLKDDPLYLAPTAEVPLTNLHRDEILKEEQLPIRYCAYTPCFRREAGSAGKDTRGMIRVHQFDKVELVKIVRPETSYDELEQLLLNAETILHVLNLHYRVVLLSSGDMGFGAAKCYDIEVWSPGVDAYLEVSSCSNFESFQARRMNLRYKGADGKNHFCHTLNGSGTALARLFIALIENGQQADGTIVLPEALEPYWGRDLVIR